MTFMDWFHVGEVVLFLAGTGLLTFLLWKTKGVLDIASAMKDMQALIKLINEIMQVLEVDDTEKIVPEIGYLKGTRPTPKEEAAAWTPPVDTADKK